MAGALDASQMTTQMGVAAIMMSRANSEANIGLLRGNNSPREPKLINLRSLTVDQQHALHYEVSVKASV